MPTVAAPHTSLASDSDKRPDAGPARGVLKFRARRTRTASSDPAAGGRAQPEDAEPVDCLQGLRLAGRGAEMLQESLDHYQDWMTQTRNAGQAGEET